MITYQDFLEIGQSDKERIEFVRRVINEHKGSELYAMAVLGDEYMRQANRTIIQYRKLLYTMSGEVVPDNYSANYKLCSNFFNRFVTQETQYLLGNGVTWENDGMTEKMGDDFDARLQEIGREALVAGVAFGFWNLDHLEVFHLREFAPLYDEENGALMAGVRFWQIDDMKPLRATFYELDGYTNFIWRDGEGEVLQEKRAYKLKYRETDADGMEIYDGENYAGFPIVPLWGNPLRQSELVGLRENIDAYDLIKSGFANDLDDTQQIYWIVQNAGGMDEVDLAKFLDQLRRVKAAVVEDDGAKADPVTVQVPTDAREKLLDRLRADMYEDYMALDTKNLAANAAVTATQIKAAYEPMNIKADQFEYCIHDFLDNILTLVGVEDDPSFTRSMIVNAQEEVQVVLQAAQYLSSDYVTEKVLTILGDGDKFEDVSKDRDEEDIDRFQGGDLNEDEEAQSEMGLRQENDGQRARGFGEADKARVQKGER